MQSLKVWHPDVLEFIECKWKEEQKAHTLIESGKYEANFNGEAYSSILFQNANLSVRVTDEFKIFTNVLSAVVDPKQFNPDSFVDFKGDVCVIPPNSFVLTRTVEYFRIPRDVITVCVGKSTYARCGLIVNVTPFEPEWEGYVTLEISNTTPLPARVYANEGIAQVIFMQSDEVCEVSYADRKGKYQKQQDIVLPRI